MFSAVVLGRQNDPQAWLCAKSSKRVKGVVCAPREVFSEKAVLVQKVLSLKMVMRSNHLCVNVFGLS